MTKQQLNAKILRLRGKKSFGLIAKELGITRNVVAGVMFRDNWPIELRVSAPGERFKNRSGTGRRGGGHPHADKTLPMGRPAPEAVAA